MPSSTPLKFPFLDQVLRNRRWVLSSLTIPDHAWHIPQLGGWWNYLFWYILERKLCLQHHMLFSHSHRISFSI